MLWLSLREEEQGLQEAPKAVFSGSGPVLHSVNDERKKKASPSHVHQPSRGLPKSLEHEDKDGDNVPPWTPEFMGNQHSASALF